MSKLYCFRGLWNLWSLWSLWGLPDQNLAVRDPILGTDISFNNSHPLGRSLSTNAGYLCSDSVCVFNFFLNKKILNK